MRYRPSNRSLTFIVGLVRFSAAFLMYWNILWGWILSAFLDIIDCNILMQWGTLTSLQYQKADKVIDLLVQLVMLAIAFPSKYFVFLLVLYFLRFVGQALFWKTANDKFLILFPNIFETFWLWLICIPSLGIPFLIQPTIYFFCLLVLLIVKITQELIVHKLGGLRAIFPWVNKLVYEDSSNLFKRFI